MMCFLLRLVCYCPLCILFAHQSAGCMCTVIFAFCKYIDGFVCPGLLQDVFFIILHKFARIIILLQIVHKWDDNEC